MNSTHAPYDHNVPDETITVLSLNLRFGLADDGPNSWQYRKKVYPLLFKKHRPDFIGFQEANDFQTEYLNGILTDYDHIGKRNPAPPFWQNNIIFYKKPWRCNHHEHFFLSPTPQIPSRFRQSKWPRQCTIGMFNNADRMLICINTHFDFDSYVQIESARQIMERLSHMPSDRPAILMGDFNTTPDAPCHTIFIGENPESRTQEAPYFKNVFREPFPATHHGFTGDTRGDHIDWILYRGGIVKKGCQVIQDTIGGRYPSDHFPLCASFKWKDGKGHAG